jgi:vacuolar-type H+-ATPase subunit E/Vma4
MGDIFGVTKTQAHNRLTEIRQKYPEFVEFLQGLAEAPQTTPGEKLQQLRESEAVRTEAEMTSRLMQIKQDLANAIEQTVSHLLDMTPEELKAMKTEHKLKHIPELVKTMRLLREQSTENIQKLSLVKAVGIATARRSSESRRHSSTDSGVAD